MPNRLNYLSAPFLHRWVSRLILFPSTHPIELANHVQRDLKFDDAVLLPQLPAELDSVANAKRSTAPVLIFSSKNDRVVPPRFHRRIYHDYAGPKMLVPLPGARHNQFPDLEEPANKAAFDWLWKQCVSFVH